MSCFITKNKDGTYTKDIESIEVCKWRVNDVCCNDQSSCLADYPYPRDICYIDSKRRCKYFEKEE